MSQVTRSDRRVVVTGMGAVTPIGIGVEKAWDAAVAGRSGIKPSTRFDAGTFPGRVAGEIRDFNPTDWMTPREVKRNDRFIQFAIAGADMAIKDSGLEMDKEDPTAIGVIVGTGLGGLEVLEENNQTLTKEGYR